MHIKRCTASIDQAYLSRYKELQKIKAAKKGLLNNYSQKMISSILRLQDKSSELVESNIQRNSRDLYSSNTTEMYDTSSFSTSCSRYPESNPKTPQKGSIVSCEKNWTFLRSCWISLRRFATACAEMFYIIYWIIIWLV